MTEYVTLEWSIIEIYSYINERWMIIRNYYEIRLKSNNFTINEILQVIN